MDDDTIFCSQCGKVPAVGALRQYIVPENRSRLTTAGHPPDPDGWITLPPQCEVHLVEHQRSILNTDVPAEHIQKIPLDEWLIRSEGLSLKGEREV